MESDCHGLFHEDSTHAVGNKDNRLGFPRALFYKLALAAERIAIDFILTLLFKRRQCNRLRTCSLMPVTEVVNTTFALYWYARIRALGRTSGRKSFNQYEFDCSSVQVFSERPSEPLVDAIDRYNTSQYQHRVRMLQS